MCSYGLHEHHVGWKYAMARAFAIHQFSAPRNFHAIWRKLEKITVIPNEVSLYILQSASIVHVKYSAYFPFVDGSKVNEFLIIQYHLIFKQTKVYHAIKRIESMIIWIRKLFYIFAYYQTRHLEHEILIKINDVLAKKKTKTKTVVMIYSYQVVTINLMLLSLISIFGDCSHHELCFTNVSNHKS